MASVLAALMCLVPAEAQANGNGEACTGDAWSIVHGQTEDVPTKPDSEFDVFQLGACDTDTVRNVLAFYKETGHLKIADRYAPSAEAYLADFRADGVCKTGNREVKCLPMGPAPIELKDANAVRGDVEDWDTEDAVLVEFFWGLCTGAAVDFEKQRWLKRHTNRPLSKSFFTLADKPWNWSETSSSSGDGHSACLEGITIRSGVRDRFANYVHIDLAEVKEFKISGRCATPDPMPQLRGARQPNTAFPHTYVHRVEWKSHWFNRMEWLVLARDHVVKRIQSAGYNIRRQGRLQPESAIVRYANAAPSKEIYRWTSPYSSKSAYDDVIGSELLVSFGREATLVLSHGPLYGDFWTRARERFIAERVTQQVRAADYGKDGTAKSGGEVEQLVQNDRTAANPAADPTFVYTPREIIMPRLKAAKDDAPDLRLCLMAP